MANTTADPRCDRLRTVILNELASRGLTRYWLAEQVANDDNPPCGIRNVYAYLSGENEVSTPVMQAIFAALDLTVSRW